MKQHRLFTKIKREPPKDAQTVSHKLLARGDFIAPLVAGAYTLLPLGLRVYRKIENIIRLEINAIGGQELFMPVLTPKALWQETGRWETIDPPLFKLKDRHNRELALGSTHEEVITDLVRNRVSSYKDLPLALYQIQTKFRNEMRPTGGLLRSREFVMKDLYSFHESEEDLIKFYEAVKKAYLNIFKRCGLDALAVEADPGTIGGTLSHEFSVLADSGEDKVLLCPKGDYAANIEKAGNIKKCPKCAGTLEVKSCIESGHAFYLGLKYSKAMKANFIDRTGGSRPIVMGCYGIGLQRLMATIVEVNHDERGIIWPESVAPFDVHLLTIPSKDAKINHQIKEKADKLYREIGARKEVLYDDDLTKSAGEKFAEADLIGIPLRIVISEKTLAKNSAEIKPRGAKEAKLVKLNKINRLGI